MTGLVDQQLKDVGILSIIMAGTSLRIWPASGLL